MSRRRQTPFSYDKTNPSTLCFESVLFFWKDGTERKKKPVRRLMTLQHRRKEEEEEEEAEFVSSSSSSSSSSRFLSPLASSLPDGASALPVPDARISLNYLERFVKSKKKRTKMGFFLLLLLLLLREGEHKFLAHCIISFLFPGGQKFRR